MPTIGLIKTHILAAVSDASSHRIRPSVLEGKIKDELDASRQEIRQALHDLVEQDRLVYTYRDPCSFLEIPAVESHSSE